MPGATFSPGPLRGEIAVPGDKSISHRALIVATRCRGTSRLTNLNAGRDVSATRGALAAMGATIAQDGTQWVVTGGPLQTPQATIDCMNSGTTARLLMGVTAGANLTAAFDGDDSLRGRPMEPVAAQLRAFGARVESSAGRLPVTVHGTADPQTRDFILVAPSAQVKSALLLCGAFADCRISISGDRGSRDHTERMLAGLGASIEFDATHVTYEPSALCAADLRIPGDLSAAAFFIVAATITQGSDITIRDVGVNPTRMGLIEVLGQMGADIRLSNPRTWTGEPVADISVRSAPLRGVSVGPDAALRAIDEIPVLSIAAARADGPTRITGIEDLRNKESDRVQAIERLLASVDVSVEVLPNGITIAGGGETAARGPVQTQGDHRTAMAAAALAAAAGPLTIDDADGIGVSFPGFIQTLIKAQA